MLEDYCWISPHFAGFYYFGSALLNRWVLNILSLLVAASVAAP